MPNAIEIRGVTKTYGAKTAVDALDLEVREGGLYGFIGPNGAGKSTTIRLIMSIIFPDRGTLRVLGRASAVESKDRIGYLPEERGVYRKMRVEAFLAYMARLKGVDAAGLDGRVRHWLGRVGLADVARKRCQELSKGMQQKVQFVSAIIHEPDLIILDEPFSGLDPVNARLTRDLINEQHARGRTVIFSTHVMQHAEQICDHIVMIDRGRKVLDATLDEIRGRFDPRTITVEPMEPGAEPPGAFDGVESVRREGAAWEMAVRDGADPAEVLRGIVARTRVRRIELRRPSLEDIFIALVREGGGEEESVRASLRDEAAGEPVGGGRA